MYRGIVPSRNLDGPTRIWRVSANNAVTEIGERALSHQLADVFELSNHQFGMMLGGAMHRLGTRDEAAGWLEVKRWMQRLDRAREFGLYAPEKSRDQ